MKKFIAIAAAVVALVTGTCALSTASVAATKAAPHYDCTKKGNANKAACKTAAATTAPAAAPAAAAPAAPAKKPGLMSKLMHPSTKAAASTPVAPAAALSPTAPTAPTTEAAAAPAGKHPVCKKGKVCGNSCIAMDKVCHK